MAAAGNFYKILGIEKEDATPDSIKKAYRRQAMKWHPDKNPDNREMAESKIKEINEAYEVLSDPKKKSTYDLYGEDAVNGGPQGYPGPQGFQGGFQGFPRGFQSNYGSGDFQGMHFSSDNMGDVLNDLFGQFFSGGPGTSAGSRSSFAQRRTTSIPKTTIERDIEVSLDDVYHGTSKKLLVKDVMQTRFGRTPIEKLVVLDIKPGWKEGTKITYKATEEFPLTIVFVIKQTPHPYFERRGDDLRWKCKLTKKQVMNGVVVRIPLLDGTKLVFNSKDDEVRNGAKRVFKGLGMPIAKGNAKQHGDLVVKFEVVI
jgi:DnaJ family protein B protein 4